MGCSILSLPPEKFDCHINVEYCQCISAIKYLFVYPFKGEDLITIEERDQYDEVKKFQARKYISACYACWRAFEKKMVQMTPSVDQLTLHLPEEQTVFYEPSRKSAEDTVR